MSRFASRFDGRFGSRFDGRFASSGVGGPRIVTLQSMGLAAWYDPSDLTTLFQNADFTNPVTASGQTFQSARDKSGNGLHLVGSATYVFSGGLHYWDFDGTDDKMVGPAISNYITASTGEAIVAYLADTIVTNVPGNVFENEAVWGDDGGIVGLPLRNASGGINVAYNFDGTVDVANRGALVTVAHVTGWRHEGGNIVNQTDALALQTAASGDTTSLTGLFTLGRQFNADTYCMDGRFYGGVWRKTVFTADERASIRAYLAAKAGVSL